MSYLEDYVSIIKNHDNVKFVSLKFLDANDKLSQIDFSVEHLDKIDLYLPKTAKLLPLTGFVDPFRSRKTISIFCYNYGASANYRELLSDFYRDINLADSVFEVSFYVDSPESSSASFLAIEPEDNLADLRADIANILKEVGVNIFYHYHGQEYGECVIAINAESAAILADHLVILKYIVLNAVASYGRQVSFVFNHKAKLIFKNLPNVNKNLVTDENKEAIKKLAFDYKLVNKEELSEELVINNRLLDNPYSLLMLLLMQKII